MKLIHLFYQPKAKKFIKEEHPIPSPIICNYCDIDNTAHQSFKSFALDVIEIESPLLILKALNFLQYYFDEDNQPLTTEIISSSHTG